MLNVLGTAIYLISVTFTEQFVSISLSRKKLLLKSGQQHLWMLFLYCQRLNCYSIVEDQLQTNGKTLSHSVLIFFFLKRCEEYPICEP